MNILVCNVGSTSLKYRLIDMPSEGLLLRGHVDRVGSDRATLKHWAAGGGEWVGYCRLRPLGPMRLSALVVDSHMARELVYVATKIA